MKTGGCQQAMGSEDMRSRNSDKEFGTKIDLGKRISNRVIPERDDRRLEYGNWKRARSDRG